MRSDLEEIAGKNDSVVAVVEPATEAIADSALEKVAAEKPGNGTSKSVKSKFFSPAAVILLRLLVGAVFVFSGFTKLVDPWGFVFKIEDYLGVLGFDWPRTIAIVGAIALPTFELICGFFLAAGCFKRVAVWMLTATMAVMLPLTFWIMIANPVADCGCFGDAWVISNSATFWKNVALTLALVYLFVYNRRVKFCIYAPAIQWIVTVVLMAWCLYIAFIGYNVQPFIDYRPFPIGTNLAQLLGGDPDARPEEPDIRFIYEKDGVRRSFTIDNLPDSSWTFINREEGSVEEESETDFAIFEGDTDVTSEIISSEGPMLLFVIPEADRVDIAYSYTANELNKAVEAAGGSSVGLISASPEAIEQWVDLSISDYPYFTVDDTSLKQLARGSMTAVYLNDGVIQWKRTLASFDSDTVDKLGHGEMDITELKFDDSAKLKRVTLYVILILAVIALIQMLVLSFCRRKHPANTCQKTTSDHVSKSELESVREDSSVSSFSPEKKVEDSRQSPIEMSLKMSQNLPRKKQQKPAAKPTSEPDEESKNSGKNEDNDKN